MLLGCGTPRNELIVDVRTDLVPGREFFSVSVAFGEEVARTPVTTDDDFLAGTRVAEFDRVPSGSARVVADLIDNAGATVLSQASLVRVEGQTAITLVLTRSCVGVTCEGDNAACLSGECVDGSCLVAAPGVNSCPSPECETSRDCSPTAPCAEASCRAGICFQGDGGECPAGQWCHPEDGCLPIEGVDAGVPLDAGPRDSGPADVGTSADSGPDAGPATIAPTRAGQWFTLGGVTVSNPDNVIAEDDAFASISGDPSEGGYLAVGSASVSSCISVGLDGPREVSGVVIGGRSAGSGSLIVALGTTPFPDQVFGMASFGPSGGTTTLESTPMVSEFALLCRVDEDVEVDFVRFNAGPILTRSVSTCPGGAPRSAISSPNMVGNTNCATANIGAIDGVGAGVVRAVEDFDLMVPGGTASGNASACVAADFGGVVTTDFIRVVARAPNTVCGETCITCGVAYDANTYGTEDGVAFFDIGGPTITDSFGDEYLPVPGGRVRAIAICRTGWSHERDDLEIDFIGIDCR